MNRQFWPQLVVISVFFAALSTAIGLVTLRGTPPGDWSEISALLLNVLTIALAGLIILLAYLRHTSRLARQLLDANQVPGRFDIQRFDEVGGLKVDFNALADQIETLVDRLKVAENTSRDLLQDLNHDLRTPLTSLSTSIETLHQSRSRLSVELQQETLNVVQSELNYFVRVLEDLFFIAELPGPGDPKSRGIVNLHELCDDVIQARDNSQPQVHWFFQDRTGRDARIEGSQHLMLRLLRNALDNAIRFANYQISITLNADQERVYLVIEDDGPGMDQQAIALFGQRRTQRIRNPVGSTALTLGLGSVIITAITRLHGGKLTIVNRSDTAASSSGAVLQFSFPRYRDRDAS